MDVLVAILRQASIYATMALGFIVVYRTSRVLNLAHPGLVLVMGYITVALLPPLAEAREAPVRVTVTIVAVLLLAGLLGAALYYLFIRPMSGQSRIAIIMMTLAMLFLAEASAQFVWSGQSLFIPLPGNTTRYEIFGNSVRLFDLVPMVGAGVLYAGVGWFYQRSRFGVQMRAVAEQPSLAARRGVDIDLIGALSWAAAGSLAVVAVVMTGTQAPVSPLLVTITLAGFSVALVGGLDSLAGAVPAALLVAGSQVLVIRYVDPQLGEAVPYLVLLIVLLVKPWGLAGTVEELDRV